MKVFNKRDTYEMWLDWIGRLVDRCLIYSDAFKWFQWQTGKFWPKWKKLLEIEQKQTIKQKLGIVDQIIGLK